MEKKYVETLGVDKDLTISDKGIFMGCCINIREYIKLIVNNLQIEVTPHKEEDSDLIGHNAEHGVVDNIGNNLQSAKEDENLDDDE